MKKYKVKLKNKITKLIVTISIFIFIILMILLLLTNKVSKSENKLQYINGTEWNNEKYPEGMPTLLRIYEGKLTAQNIGKSIYYVATEVLPNYKVSLKEVNDNDIKKYYKKNTEEIFMNIGSISETEFVSLIQEISKLKTEQLKLETFYIDIDSIVRKNGYLLADLIIKYEGEKEILLEIQVLDDFKTESSSVKYYK